MTAHELITRGRRTNELDSASKSGKVNQVILGPVGQFMKKASPDVLLVIFAPVQRDQASMGAQVLSSGRLPAACSLLSALTCGL